MRKLTRLEFEELCDLFADKAEGADFLTALEQARWTCAKLGFDFYEWLEFYRRMPPPSIDDVPPELDRKVARHLAGEQGIELTPDQVHEIRRKAFDKVRAAMRARGWVVPRSDLAFLVQLKKSKETQG